MRYVIFGIISSLAAIVVVPAAMTVGRKLRAYLQDAKMKEGKVHAINNHGSTGRDKDDQ